MGNSDLNEQLIEAIREDSPKIIKKLIKKGADLNAFIGNTNQTLLMQAAEEGNLKIAQTLIDLGADIDAKNRDEDQTALFFACWEGNQNIAKLLIEKGSDVLHKKKGDRTTLMYAVHSNSLEVIRILLDKGVKPDVANEIGLTALMYADDADDRIDSMRLLLEHGADINLKNSIGKTVLMRAALYGSLRAVKFLLESGADISLVSDEGYDVIVYAEDADKNSKPMIELLKKHGVKDDLKYYCYKIHMACPQCGQPILINGPMRNIKCAACSSKVQIGVDTWKSIIESSDGTGGTVSFLSLPGFNFEYSLSAPLCSSCNNKLDANKVDTGSTGPLICSKCGAKNSTFPSPEWLSRFKVGGMSAKQIFCAESENTEITIEKGEMAPIAINCVSCGAALTIDLETPRNATCGHCDTVQYLPDGLWLALHPIKTRKLWYLRFTK